MIFSSIQTKDDFKAYPEAVRRVIDYLKSSDFVNMEAGVYEIQGKDIYAQVFDATTGPAAEKRPESHNDYLDIQFLASGEEKLGLNNYDFYF